MSFVKYQHIERFGTDEVENINLGRCYVFPKLDGTSGCVWGEGTIGDPSEHIFQTKCGSRNRELSLGKGDNQGFMAHVLGNQAILKLLHDRPELRLYGEWLVRHSFKDYQESAWRKFYVFDVIATTIHFYTDGDKVECEERIRYLTYDEYQSILEEYKIDYIPVQAIMTNPTEEQLIAQLEKNIFLVQDGKGPGEGIVIKNYEYRNKYGRITWAKLVRNEFKTLHSRIQPTEIDGKKVIEEEIVEKYLTAEMIEKTYAKIVNDWDVAKTTMSGAGVWSPKMIPQLLGCVYHDFVTEEIWRIVKDYKFPKIDFKSLRIYAERKIKRIKPELF